MKDRVVVCNIIFVFVYCENERVYEDIFLYFFILFFIVMFDEFVYDDFCSVVFDDYFFVRIYVYI